MASSSIRIRRRLDGQLIQGSVAFAAVAGLFVNYDPTDITKLSKATGVRGFALMRPVVSADDLLSQLTVDQVFPVGAPVLNPSVIGDTVSASKLLEAELEGPDLLLTSGTGALNGSTAVGTEISTTAGKLYAKQGGDEVVAIVRAKLTALDSDNAVRLLLEFV